MTHITYIPATPADARLAYETDVRNRPLFSNGQPRKRWPELSHTARQSWRRGVAVARNEQSRNNLQQRG